MLNQEQTLDQTFHALADPARRAMLERLSRGTASVSDLARTLTMSLPAVMQHLAVLEGAGLVISQKSGRVRTCRIDANALTRAQAWIDARRMEKQPHFDRLENDVDDMKGADGNEHMHVVSSATPESAA